MIKVKKRKILYILVHQERVDVIIINQHQDVMF